MKQVKKKLILISLVSLCLQTSQLYASGAKRPELEETDTVTENQPSTETPSSPTPTPSNPDPLPVGNGAYVDHIVDIAGSSSCATYSWQNRGKAPAGYIKGMALSYARSLCRLKANEDTPSPLASLLSAARSSSATKDALTHYQSVFSGLNMITNVAGQQPLRALYTLGIGLGMRESSGKYCEGWDRSASSTRPSSAGEAGLFQTSYDSMGVHAELRKLYTEYQANKESCFLPEFKQGVTCSATNMSNLGTGAGADYQAFVKSCPAFAAEYAMVTLRILRAHYGPINRMEAEVIPACHQMLTKVQELINNDPNACQDLI